MFRSLVVVFGLAFLLAVAEGVAMTRPTASKALTLPEPARRGIVSFEEVLAARRSVREFTDESLTLAEVAQLLWAAQGITDKAEGLRTAPSAGALYPLEVYLLAGNVEDLTPGTYRYRPDRNRLEHVDSGDKRADLAAAALYQNWVEHGAAVIVIAGVYERTARKYGSRADRYVHIEVGHAVQNIYLEAASLGLGTVMVGAFEDSKVKRLIGMQPGERPLGIMPVGRTK